MCEYIVIRKQTLSFGEFRFYFTVQEINNFKLIYFSIVYTGKKTMSVYTLDIIIVWVFI